MLGETLNRWRIVAIGNRLADKCPILATNALERECERRERNGSLGMLAVAGLILLMVAATFTWPDALLRESGQPHPKLMLWILRAGLTACAASLGFLAGDSLVQIHRGTNRDREAS